MSGLRHLEAGFAAVPALQACATGTKDCQRPVNMRVAPALRLLETLV